jgi:hypothetical protein
LNYQEYNERANDSITILLAARTRERDSSLGACKERQICSE